VTSFASPRVKKMQRREGHLDLSWTDSTVSEIPLRWLRETCACAVCLEKPMKELFDRMALPALEQSLKITGIEPVGNYGFSVTWGDKHRSIYAFDRVRNEFNALSLPPHIQAVSTTRKGCHG